MELDGMIRSLLKRMCDQCDKQEESFLFSLDHNQIEEWGSIKAQVSSFDERLTQLLKEGKVIKAREALFWAKIKLKVKDPEGILSIKNDKVVVYKCKKEDGMRGCDKRRQEEQEGQEEEDLGI